MFECTETTERAEASIKEMPTVVKFLKEILGRTRLSTITLVLALFYLDRLKGMHPACRGTHGSGHRLLLSSLMVSSKYLFDDTYDNKTWCLVSKCFSLSEVNQMENEFLYFLQYKLSFKPFEFEAFVSHLEELLSAHMLVKSRNFQSQVDPSLYPSPALSLIKGFE
ncbi:hypothetical protein ROZALSC1DRAFT_27074 [Rozella allomycis CSF55]|uniref:Uncharacterized protein n=1 Tax=Rozella allomycis (strain CSF55) TaxID=988480 RepID=A0A075AZV7_ROZAC|nr:hypothetical protein O9G_002647 [Rozella allomycis CSF55]RKP21538.1 hypothetical protein ROZALSC1DRAFT_27074 [Rozella allomycis CSF55]|eukprot:EPZ35639.1 hypothetical protein O9G_002647 [Rozella allomycis CSF55]